MDKVYKKVDRKDPAGFKIYEIRGKGNQIIDVTIRIEFVNNEEWIKILNDHISIYQEWFDSHPVELNKMVTYARGISNPKDEIIYIKESAREDDDFQWLLLHELGHGICGLPHSEYEGSIMHSDYRKWIKDEVYDNLQKKEL